MFVIRLSELASTFLSNMQTLINPIKEICRELKVINIKKWQAKKIVELR